MSDADLEIYLVATPGLEQAVAEEAREHGFAPATLSPGGVTLRGRWLDVWRANLVLRGPSRILARLGAFRALHLAQLDKRARRFEWAHVMRADVPVRVEATCRKSKIYHSGAAAQRIGTAIADELGAPLSPDADVVIKARIEEDLCTLAVDTSGEPLHKRGHKAEVNKAPMRETMAALFLRSCLYRGDEPVLDPMCGSGTFVIEAAEIAAGLLPGRSRSFAFEKLATFDPERWAALKAAAPAGIPRHRCFGSDRDLGAVRMSRANAERAGVGETAVFERRDVSEIAPPVPQPGLVIVNPPYGGRIGEAAQLQRLYRTLGTRLAKGFSGWRVGVITADPTLAKATGLPFATTSPPVLHGGTRINLYLTGPLP